MGIPLYKPKTVFNPEELLYDKIMIESLKSLSEQHKKPDTVEDFLQKAGICQQDDQKYTHQN